MIIPFILSVIAWPIVTLLAIPLFFKLTLPLFEFKLKIKEQINYKRANFYHVLGLIVAQIIVVFVVKRIYMIFQSQATPWLAIPFGLWCFIFGPMTWQIRDYFREKYEGATPSIMEKNLGWSWTIGLGCGWLDSGAKPSHLKLELTESTVLENVEDTIAKMEELKLLGVSFSLDDFGTGYSSLQYLKRLPLDQIKIDQTFVHDIVSDTNDAAIVQTIIAMTEALGLQVIAEGVENDEQRAFLDDHGCHAFQGNLFSKPIPLDQLEAMLQGVQSSA